MVSLNRKVNCVTMPICSRSEEIFRSRRSTPSTVMPSDGRVVEARDQVGERRLAATAHADQRHRLAAAQHQVDVAQRVVGLDAGVARNVARRDAVGRRRRAGPHRIAEAHALEADLLGERRQRQRVAALEHVARLVDELEHALGRGEPLLDRAVDLRQPLERLVDQDERGQEAEERALGATAVDHRVAAVQHHRRDAEGSQQLHDRLDQRLGARRLHVEPEQALVLGAEAGRARTPPCRRP